VTTPYFLVYASTATEDFGERRLVELLEQSRKTNASLGITGLLLYSPGNGIDKGTFVQVLEGPRPEVQALYVKISRDRRHRDCTILQEGVVFQRRFAEWTMGFRNLATLKPEQLPGFNPIFLKNWSLTTVLTERDPVIRLLYSFAGT